MSQNMITVVEVLSTIYRRQVHMAINYMLQCPSEIRDESFVTDFCKEGQFIIIADELPVGYFSSYKRELNGKKYTLIHLFEIFYPFRGKDYAKQTIQFLSQKQTVIITHPLSISHWIKVLGVNYFRNQIQSIGLHDYYKLVKMDPYGEGYGENDRLPFYRRLLYDNSFHQDWPEYHLAIKADIVAPIVELEHYISTIHPICYITLGESLIGKMINGVYLVPSVEEVKTIINKYKLKYQPKDMLPQHPSKDRRISLDSYLSLMRLGSSKIYNIYEEKYYDLTIDYRLRIYEEDDIIGVLMGNEILDIQ